MENTETLKEFEQNAAFYAARLKQSQEPLVLTIDGRAELVVLDAETYQKIIAKAEFAETVEALKEGIEDFERGTGKPARQAFAELAKKYAIPS